MRVISVIRLALGVVSLLFVGITRAADLYLAGPSTTWLNLTVLTNSARAADVFSSGDHAILSTSEVATCLALLPDWSAWQSTPGGRLDVWAETVADASNAVTVLLGEPAAPELTVARSSDWTITPAGSYPLDESVTPRFGPDTNRIHLVFYPHGGAGQGSMRIETQTPGGVWTPRPDLVPASLGWVVGERDVPHWTSIGLSLAGPYAKLNLLCLRWAHEGTVLILR